METVETTYLGINENDTFALYYYYDDIDKASIIGLRNETLSKTFYRGTGITVGAWKPKGSESVLKKLRNEL